MILIQMNIVMMNYIEHIFYVSVFLNVTSLPKDMKRKKMSSLNYAHVKQALILSPGIPFSRSMPACLPRWHAFPSLLPGFDLDIARCDPGLPRPRRRLRHGRLPPLQDAPGGEAVKEEEEEEEEEGCG